MPKKKTKKVTPESGGAVAQELTDEVQAEAVTASTALDTGSQLEDETQLDAAAAEFETQSDAVVPADVAAVHSDTPVAKQASGETPTKRVNVRASQTGLVRTGRRKGPLPKARSVRYMKAQALAKAGRRLPLADAIELAKQASYTKFDGTIELHVRLRRKKGSEQTPIRGLLSLPHGTGKTIKAAMLTEDLIEQITKAGKTEHDVLIATPALMPKVAKIARILGPQGKMPTPKAGTVTDDPEAALAAIQSGRTEYKSDSGGSIHLPIGKVSWSAAQLLDNAQAVLAALPTTQLLSVTVAATMGPGIAVAHQDL